MRTVVSPYKNEREREFVASEAEIAEVAKRKGRTHGVKGTRTPSI